MRITPVAEVAVPGPAGLPGAHAPWPTISPAVPRPPAGSEHAPSSDPTPRRTAGFIARVRQWHQRLRKMRHFSYASVRGCGDRSDRVQVGLRDENDTAYFLLVEGEPRYAMTAVSTRSDPACDGVNLLETR